MRRCWMIGLALIGMLQGGGAMAQQGWGPAPGVQRWHYAPPSYNYHEGRPLYRPAPPYTAPEPRGSSTYFYDWRGGYEGRSERSAGGGVRRFYDADGRYLGREDINRDFRRPRWAE